MTKEELKVMIDETINSNGVRNITGKALNLALNAIVDSMGTGSSSEDEGLKRNDVNFFDYDGTLLYAYAWEEAKALTELPSLPVHDGLEVRGWNYTLEDIKAQGTETNIGKADVGACVYNSNGDQVLAPFVFIFERNSDSIIDMIYQVPAWVISIPNTVTNLESGFMNNAACLNELKIPISVTEIASAYGGAFGYSFTESQVWWNGDNKEYDILIDFGMSMEIPKNFTKVSINTGGMTRIVLHENVESIISTGGSESAVLWDFTRATFVPTLEYEIDSYSPYSIVVPDALYDEWINATNWSDSADKIIKHSMLPWLK